MKIENLISPLWCWFLCLLLVVGNTAFFTETAARLDITLRCYDAQNRLKNLLPAFHNFSL